MVLNNEQYKHITLGDTEVKEVVFVTYLRHVLSATDVSDEDIKPMLGKPDMHSTLLDQSKKRHSFENTARRHLIRCLAVEYPE
ncbi:hypothetical protein DPMN_075693 [Dreissena polymorpha]|uniref:Uncharacterized protein n=1 Tax=Dreissena polymorpha TaxID=45954 RepID=A0A9D4BLR2_DREPO|nr:hypothetical protein DPMN_075693 [Dreissena polymorpha]